MAKRKRRKNAGPPPAGVSRKASAAAAAEARRPAPKRLPGEPVPPSFQGVVIRAAIVAAIFYPYLVFVVGESPAVALFVTLLAFGLMVPLGMLLDRFRYRRQLRRWQQRRTRQSER